MKNFTSYLKKAFGITLVLIVLCGVVYPLVMTGAGQLLFKKQANGSMIEINGKKVGSELIGQEFEGEQYFQGRVSSVNYNVYSEKEKEDGTYTGPASGSYNYGSTTEELQTRVEKDMKAFQKKYESFVPSKLFYILQKSGIKCVSAGEGKNFNATVMAVNSVGYKRAVLKKYDEVFSYSNKYLPKEIPIIHSYGGTVRRIFEGGEETVFTKESKNNVAECAVDLMQKLNDTKEGFSIGIAKEALRFGVIGLPKRMVPLTISEHGSLSWFLQQMAVDFGSCILISSSAADDIENFFNRYSTRTIGYLHISSENRLEAVYEILNGESQERQRLKLDTKTDFEEGVKLFMAESFVYARKRFIDVLQRDSKDKAAREYVLLCDRSLKGEIVKPWLKEF